MDINIIQKNIKKINIKYKKIKKILKFHEIKKKIKKIQKIFTQNIWNNYNLYSKITKKYLILKKKYKKIIFIKKNIKILNKYLNNINENLYKKKKIKIKIHKVKEIINSFKIKIFLKNKNDKKNCYMDIKSGIGGIDAQNWAYKLYQMYKKWIEKKKFKKKILNITYTETGIKSLTMLIIGKYAYGYLKNECGIHRLIRYSPFNSDKKKQTSFASIFIYPKINKSKKNILNLSEIKVDVYKSSGAGGQHVNKTESAVRIIHIPTGIKTQCQNSRSQHKNKKQAIKQIISKIYNFYKIKKKKIQKPQIKWGSQIRSYFLNNNRIKDHILKTEINNINHILNGNIDIFIKKNLEKKTNKKS